MKRVTGMILRLFLPIFLSAISIILLIYFGMNIKKCSSYFENEAKTISQNYSVRLAQNIDGEIKRAFSNTDSIAAQLKGIFDAGKGEETANALIQQYSLRGMQLILDKQSQGMYGKVSGFPEGEEVAEIMAAAKNNTAEVIDNAGENGSLVCLYRPVADSNFADGVITFFSLTDLVSIDSNADGVLLYGCIAKKDGSVVTDYSKKGFQKNQRHNIFTFLSTVSDEKATLDIMKKRTSSNYFDSYSLKTDSGNYIVSNLAISGLKTDCSLFCIYDKENLLKTNYTLYDNLSQSAFGIIIICLVIIIQSYISNIRARYKKSISDITDPMLGGNNYNKFKIDTEQILTANKLSQLAIVYVDINKFSVIRENFSSEIADGVIRYMNDIVRKLIGQNETYGHLSEDRFLLLLHYSDFNEIDYRMKIINALAKNYTAAKENNFALRPSIGIYVIDRSKKYSIQQMVDRAIIAQKTNKNNGVQPYAIYDESVKTAYLQESEIEAKMETALAQKDFKVFYQPKYNIKKDWIDGAEALVRWYDKQTNSFILPQKYVPFFEVNGFISKLDRYVFERVCQYIRDCVENGINIVPISVNVSRVTATKPDFLSFYIEKKKEYGVADGFLMIEFTESFAFEDYETLFSIISTLKANGFKCSIDDFGSGYSSFNILKRLEMDELKLDRLFLLPGGDPQKDRYMHECVVKLGNNFNMKVTQEGVETNEQLKEIIELGCDVVQGYYYSKPLPQSDFTAFLESDTSMNSVILHHISKKEKVTV